MLEPLSILNLIITICVVIGGYVALRSGFTRTANEVQERVINALQSEIQSLHDRITMLEQENVRLKNTIAALCSALRLRGIQVTIDDNSVSIHDLLNNDRTYTARIHAQGDGSLQGEQNGDAYGSASRIDGRKQNKKAAQQNKPAKEEQS